MLKVLVVDDEGPIRQWLEYCVDQFEGFTVAGAAASGAQALELYRRELPDIVVSDIEMPGMDGLEMLRQMQQLHPAYAIILTSHEDFSYARRALTLGTAEYILKTEITMDSLRQVLDKAAKAIRAQGFSGGGDMERSAQRLLQQLALEGCRGQLTTETLRRQGVSLEEGLLMAADFWSRDGASLPQLRQVVAELPGLDNLCLVPLGYEHLLAAANLRQEGSYRLAVECFQAQSHLPCVVGVSDLVQGLQQLPEALRMAQARCRLHFYHPERRVFWRESVGVSTPRRVDTWQVAFSKELFGQHYQEAAAIKDQAIREILDDCPTDLDAVKGLCAFFASTLMHLTMEQSEGWEACLEEVERRIAATQDMGQLTAILDQVFAPFASGLPRPGSYSEPIREAIAYMKSHYAEKLTLGMVAGRASFNPEYFSRMFTKETGLNFVTYLNNLRMRRAVELLERTDKKIYEIAEEVGYSSVSYFSTAFKKTFGQTPNEYQLRARRPASPAS